MNPYVPPARRGQTAQNTARNGAQLLQDAEKAQTSADRRQGSEAVPYYERATDLYRRALQQGLTGDERSRALYGLADTQQGWGSALWAACTSLPDQQLSPAVEAEAAAGATRLYDQAISMYRQVIEEGGGQAEACVNAGNALCARAELADGAAALPDLEAAVQAYRTALTLEEDTETWSNLGACHKEAGEVLAGEGRAQLAEEQYEKAVEAYGKACSLCSAAAGDDLPSLLHDWGVALYSYASYTTDRSRRLAALAEAEKRLRASVELKRGDVAPLLALGEVLVLQAENADSPTESMALLQAALSDGFGAALRVNAASPDACAGKAECHVALARLLDAGGQAEAAAQAMTDAVDSYERALSDPTKLGNFQERCELRYNFACTLVLAGQLEKAQSLLEELAGVPGGLSAEDLETDPDFSGVRQTPWFQQILSHLRSAPS